jgi:fibronectin type 3 domain-containing protein
MSAFIDCTSLNDITIPSSVTFIDEQAFSGCTKLTSISIPKGVSKIESWAFLGCTSLSSVTISDGVTCIGYRAFGDCTSLSKINLPESVTTIGDFAFDGCTNLESIEIPSCETSVGIMAFEGCNKLKITYSKHKYTSKVTKPTYTTKGYTTYTCSVCGYTYTGKETAMLKLSQPTVTLANLSTGVNISWTKTEGATGYYIYRKTGSESWTRITTVKSGSTLAYTDTKAVAGTTYYYTVKAYADTNLSSFVTNKTIKYLKQPTVTLANASNGVKVTWSKTTGASGYYVYRKASGAKSWTLLKKITSGSTVSYTDTAAKAGTTYYYTVKAYSGSTNSSFVTNKTIKRLTQPVVTLSNVTKGVKISWKKITGATGYIVYRKTASGSWSRIKTITSASTLSYTDTIGKNGTTYYYTVKAYSGSINSSFVTNKSIKYKK